MSTRTPGEDVPIRRLDRILPSEQGGVAGHRVAQQAFVGVHLVGRLPAQQRELGRLAVPWERAGRRSRTPSTPSKEIP